MVPLGDSAIDQHGQAFVVTGLSGLTHIGGGAFIAVMDNSNRLVQIDVSFGPDGLADVADFFAFVLAFFTGERAADVDGDGRIDLDDFSSFLAAFERGCI